jgi:hypothetical protein
VTDEQYPDLKREDVVYGDRRISRPDSALPDWEVPDTTYRPIPIVWFTGALIGTLLALTFLAVVLSAQSAWLTIVLAILATAAIGWKTWQRGMRYASRSWKLATALMLAGQIGFLILAMGPRL